MVALNLGINVVFGSHNNLVKDSVVNSWHMRGESAGDNAKMKAEAAAKLHDFYNGPDWGATPILNVGSYLSYDLLDVYHIFVYDMADTKPRVPLVFEFTKVSASQGHNLPPQVALCSSYYAGRNLPRTRGRIYLGPFNRSAEPTAENSQGRPDSVFTAAIVAASQRLVLPGLTGTNGVLTGMDAGNLALLGATAGERAALNDVIWTQHSTKRTDDEDVTGGWVDDSFDIIRRRKVEALNRYTWSI